MTAPGYATLALGHNAQTPSEPQSGLGLGDHLPRIRFGPAPTQVIPADWAEHMLSAWREKAPKAFGEALAKAALEAR